MHRLNPGLVAATVLAALNVGRGGPLGPALILDLDRYRATLPRQHRMHIADRARIQDGERWLYRVRLAMRQPTTLGDLHRLNGAEAKRADRAQRRAASLVAGGWANASRRARGSELVAA